MRLKIQETLPYCPRNDQENAAHAEVCRLYPPHPSVGAWGHEHFLMPDGKKIFGVCCNGDKNAHAPRHELFLRGELRLRIANEYVFPLESEEYLKQFQLKLTPGGHLFPNKKKQ